ncbi:MAG TPA: sigma-70 family RNA polymerase sigma factor [Ilumatobacter sp.]
MVEHRTDRELVAAHVSGDRSALAAIYDRYADPLYDTAAAMLGDRHEAEDLTHDVFVLASRKLGQLRQPERLRAWLFAVLRHEVYRRSAKRRRIRPVDPTAPGMAEMTGSFDNEGEGAAVERAELAVFVREAALGLGARDQLLLELSARQDLTGADLADAMGVTQQQCHVLLHRMRERVQRSIGALTVARYGRKECPDLQALLAGWNGEFDELTRKRVAGHVDDCEICGETSRKWAVLPLFSAAPALAAPIGLRDRVLASTSGGGDVDGYRFDDAHGFPRLARATRPLALVCAAVIALLVMLGGTWLAIAGSDDTPASAGSTTNGPTSPPTLLASPPTTTPTTTPPSSVSDTTTAAVATTPPPPTPPPLPPPLLPGQLTLSATTIDLGSALDQTRVVLTNTGGQPLEWSLTGELAPFIWSTTGGELMPGADTELRIGIERDGLLEGDYQRDVTITSSGEGGTILTALAAVEHPPTVTPVRFSSTLACPSPVGLVTVTVVDESQITSVELTWTGTGVPGAARLNQGGEGWTGRLTPARINGPWTWIVHATDTRGNVGTASAPFLVTGC